MLETIKHRALHWARSVHERLYYEIKGRLDYYRSRGFEHERTLQNLADDLTDLIDEREREISNREDKASSLRRKIRQMAREKVVDHYLNTRLQEVGGIGSKLADRLRGHRRISDLQSLKRHASSVRGIGESKAFSLQYWAERMEDELDEDAEKLEKDETEFVHERQEISSLEEICDLRREEIEEIEELLDSVQRALEMFSRVSPSMFAKAWRESAIDEESARAIDQFLLGAYPPWANPPVWLSRAEKLVGDG